ncbi:aliphatic sulfonate ABC transporter substrate-binding protein [Streptomyces sp. NBC_00876]|uniref:aliphatic sulfonate ABC transporter substrate-binding protein n=1 Tax=Streptomyces sp. NBC_00876 TaxID=2975853 RepID=UPI00386EFACC|nr:aliphatic sulfonate ABC transporter substrate-binding protein [Streptomyces sp. NBC_00876]
MLAGTLRRGLAAAALSFLGLVATGCGYGSAAEPTEHDRSQVTGGGKKIDGLDTVRIGYFPNLTHATALIGRRQGLLQRELGGTESEYSVFNAGPSEIEAINSGSLDIGFIGPSPSINAYMKSSGRNLRIISGAASGGVKFVVNPDRIKSLDDVRGKRISTPQKGNTQDVAFLNWISERGWKVDPESGKGDVSVFRTDNKVAPAAYKSGSIDGAWVPEPTASQLVAEGAKVLIDEAALWPDERFVVTNLIVSQTFLKEHPDVVEAVLRGTVRTTAWIKANPDTAKAAANTQLKADTGKELPADILAPAWKSIRFTYDPLAATLTTEAEQAVRVGLLDEPDLQGVFDLRLLNKVLKNEGRPPVQDAGLGIK